MKPTPTDDCSADLLGRMLAEHGAALALYAAQWTVSAEDCVQEGLLELVRQSPMPENTVAWLYRVVKHRALNAARSERRRRAHEQNAWRERLTARDCPTQTPTHLELVDSLARLTEAQREVVMLKTWGGLTFAEIARVTGDSSSTAHRQYQQALDHLRQLWEVPCPNSAMTH